MYIKGVIVFINSYKWKILLYKNWNKIKIQLLTFFYLIWYMVSNYIYTRACWRLKLVKLNIIKWIKLKIYY